MSNKLIMGAKKIFSNFPLEMYNIKVDVGVRFIIPTHYSVRVLHWITVYKIFNLI